jgi:hypothetical protein
MQEEIMRATYVNSSDLLTPIGDWIAARLPHLQTGKKMWNGTGTVLRVYGLAPMYRLSLVDYTAASFYPGKGRWRRLKVLGVKVFEINSHLSGLPKSN